MSIRLSLNSYLIKVNNNKKTVMMAKLNVIVNKNVQRKLLNCTNAQTQYPKIKIADQARLCQNK